METEKEQIFRTYAWSYFSFHAEQRTKTFNFFLAVAGVLAVSAVALMRENVNPWLVAPLGFGLSILCLLFWRLDQRNHTLVRNGEAAIRFLDAQHGLADSKGIPHVLCIFERDDHNTNKQSRSLFCKGYFSYSQVIGYVYLLFACLGIFFVVAPFFAARAATPSSQLLASPPSTTSSPSVAQGKAQTIPITQKTP